MKSPSTPARPEVVIRADESALWQVAGLPQLERLLRTLEESLGEPAVVRVVWSTEVPPAERVVPAIPDLCLLDLTTAESSAIADLEISTRLVPYRRKGFPRLSVAELAARWGSTKTGEDWEYLQDQSQIGPCEKRFLRGSGKSQDGLVSRYLNRPISRAISRHLVRHPITPSGWTLAIVVLPLIGAWFLARGQYTEVIAGLLFYQLYSILDGCDGEIARAKYLESTRGRQLDTWCDIAGNLLLALSLGYGLSGSYFLEGIGVAGLIAINELILALPSPAAPAQRQNDSALYPRHRRMVEKSGLLLLGPRTAWWLVQLTKRDVAMLFFLFLGLMAQPGWILHLLGGVALISSFLALRSRRSR